MAKKFYTIEQEARVADVYIFGYIVSDQWYEDEVTAKSIVNEINALDVDLIRVHIDSYGGEVSEGWAMYNALREHPARVDTYADGFVCSAALYPYLAGESRNASILSAFYLHEVSSHGWGYASDLRAAADEAEKLTDIGINAFVERAGLDAEKVKELMAAETWLSPEEALELNIATAIIQDNSPGAQQSAKKAVMQRITQHRTAQPPKNENPPAKGDNTKPESTLCERLAGFFNA